MIANILTAAAVLFFAANMGASGLAPAFAAPYGARLITRWRATAFFSACVVLGAVTMGRRVSMTLGGGLIPREQMTPAHALIIIAAAGASLCLANRLRIPQSTSQVTVAAVAGVGIGLGRLDLSTLFLRIVPFWFLLPFLSYLCSYLAYRVVYPPTHRNMRLLQKLAVNERAMRAASIIVSCYVAFAIGANNVANAVGPLAGAGMMTIATGLLLVAPLFGRGAAVMGKGPLETTGTAIVPLGAISSIVISLVTGTLLLVASLRGVPQSLVQLNVGAIWAVSCIKNGRSCTIAHRVTRKTVAVWAVTPLIAGTLAYLASRCGRIL